jgi:isopenicillin N synthase-like dioxygenase
VKRVLGAKIDGIFRATGFVAVTGHGVPDATIEAAWTAAASFFALPAERKARARAPYPGYPYGYLAPETESLARSHGIEAPPDRKESFNGGPMSAPSGLTDPEALAFCYAPTIWPEAPDGFRHAWAAYYAAMETLAERIMTAFAVALGLPEAFFAPFVDAPISALRALNYPALTSPPAPGQIRAGAHTDYGSLTILLPQAESRGLEIRAPDGNWIEVRPRPGAFIVNIGDLMGRWTNDRWTSTLHRVVIPADGGAARRQSFAFFHQPNWNAEIAPLDVCLAPGERPKYPPVRSGPYLMSKFKSTTV